MAGDAPGLTPAEIQGIPALLGTGLPEQVVARLPTATPPAPWHSNVETALWTFRSTAASRDAVPAPFGAGAPLGAGAFVSYLDGAVGAYREVLVTPRCVTLPGRRAPLGHVPFIAVDSIPSIHGGRTNWALPKLWAQFHGDPAFDANLSAEGEGWSISAQLTHVGPWLPFRAGASCAQPWPDGGARIFASRFAGRLRLARLTVEVAGPASLTTVIPAGRHWGVVIRGRVDVGAPHRP